MGLGVSDFKKGKCYVDGGTFSGALCIKVVSVGPVFVRYQEWNHDYSDWRNPYEWSGIKKMSRFVFESWDGTWNEISDPEE